MVTLWIPEKMDVLEFTGDVGEQILGLHESQLQLQLSGNPLKLRESAMPSSDEIVSLMDALVSRRHKGPLIVL